MKWMSLPLLLCTCLSRVPAAAQEEPGLLEQGKQGVKALVQLLLKDHGDFLSEVEKALSGGELGTAGGNVVIQINTRLATLSASEPSGLINTLVHDVAHLINEEDITKSREFLNMSAAQAARTLAWQSAVEAQSAAVGQFAMGAPIKAEAVTKQLRWADQELRGIHDRLSSSPTTEDVERELRNLSRIRTTLQNTSRALVSLVERGRKWLDEIENSGGSHADGLQQIKRFQADTVEGKAAAQYLPAVAERVRSSVQVWISTGEVALEANMTARKEAQEEFDPFEQETLLKEIPAFKDAKFADLADVVKPHEQYLRNLQEQLKNR